MVGPRFYAGALAVWMVGSAYGVYRYRYRWMPRWQLALGVGGGLIPAGFLLLELAESLGVAQRGVAAHGLAAVSLAMTLVGGYFLLRVFPRERRRVHGDG